MFYIETKTQNIEGIKGDNGEAGNIHGQAWMVKENIKINSILKLAKNRLQNRFFCK